MARLSGALARPRVAARWRGLHPAEYLMEAAGLAAFMLSACLFTALLEHPASPVRAAIPDGDLRRVPMGLAMGLTALAIIHTPWGMRSGAHLNPAFTLAYLRLGKIAPADALGYVAGQFAGGLAGVLLAAALLREAIGHPSVNYAATVPGAGGVGIAFLAELLMTFGLMTAVLHVSNRPALARWTPFAAAGLVAAYIAIEAPLSGMSLNPARTLGSGLPAGVFTGLWIYFTAPPLGMLLAAEIYRRAGATPVRCAKLHHHNDQPCIFRCGYDERRG